MANLTTTDDLQRDVLDRGDEVTDGSSEYHGKVLEYLNRQQQSIALGGCEIAPELRDDWWWLQAYPPGILTLVSPITTGTVAVTQNSTAITLSVAPAASVAGYGFRVTSDQTVYRIATHTAGQQPATLDSVYVGSTDAVAAYTLLKQDYTLANDVLRLTGPMRCTVSNENDDPYKIYSMARDEIELEYPPLEMLTGVPEVFAVIAQATNVSGSSTAWTVRFNRGGRTTGQTRVEYEYLRLPPFLVGGGTEEPLIPLPYRHVLADAALYLLFVQKNDARADTVGLSAKAGLQAMAREHRTRLARGSELMGQLRPRSTETRRRRLWSVWRA